jgi:hypothetical protein
LVRTFKNGEHIVAEKIYWGRDVVSLSIIIFIYNHRDVKITGNKCELYAVYI